MRRLLKAIANNETIGDVSTLEDGAAVTEVQTAFQEIQKPRSRTRSGVRRRGCVYPWVD